MAKRTRQRASHLSVALIIVLCCPGTWAAPASPETKPPPVNLNDFDAVRAFGLEKFEAGKYKAADKYLNIARTLALADTANPEKLLSVLHDLGVLHEQRGLYWQAYRDYNQIYTARSRTKGPDDRKLAAILINLGRVNYLLGNLPQARQELEEAHEILQKLNDESPLKARALWNLAQINLNYGQLSQAKAEAEEALALSKKQDNPKNLQTCRSLLSLAKQQLMSGQLLKAEESVRQASAIAVDSSQESSLARADCLDTCAQIYLNEGRTDQALSVEEEAAGIRERFLGPEHPATAEAFATLAIIAIAQKDYAAARAFLERSATIVDNRFGPDSITAARILAIKGTCAKLQGVNDEAKTSFSKSSDIVFKQAATDNPAIRTLYDLNVAFAPPSSPKQGFWDMGGKPQKPSTFSDPLSRCLYYLITDGAIVKMEEVPETTPPQDAPLPSAGAPKGGESAPPAAAPVVPMKVALDTKVLWLIGAVTVPIFLLVLFFVYKNFFGAVGSSSKRPPRRPGGKQQGDPAQAENAPAGEGPESSKLMGRFVDEGKVNKRWDNMNQ